MITATWCENRALMVGMPRRSAEWSTESACTRVARWISSTTAASVTARGGGSSPPAAWWLSSSSVGRNSLPFIRSRCSLTSTMTGKSAAMMRRSSSTTRSRVAATGRWMSRRATGATCWLTSFRLGECFHAPAHVHEADVHGGDASVQVLGFGFAALLLQRAAQPIEHAEALLVARRRQLQAAPRDRFRDAESPLREETPPQGLRRAELALGGAQRFLELGDGLVQQAHLLEGDPEVVVRLEVRLVDVLVDPLLEPGEHVVEVLLLVARGLLVLHLHARVARGLLVLEHHRAEVDEVTPGPGLVAHCHLRVLRLDLLVRLGGRSDRRRRQHGQGGLGALVLPVVLHHPLVDGARLLRQIAAQQRVRQLEVSVDQLALVPRVERQLDLLLAVPHAVGIEAQDLLHQVLGLGEGLDRLEAAHRDVQLLAAALALPRLDQRFSQRLVRLCVVRVLADRPLQLLDGRRR